MLNWKTPTVLLVTGLVAIVVLNCVTAVTEVPTKSSRILNASFIQWKILQRYHPSRNVKHPTVILKLNGESGSLVSQGSQSTLPPFTVSQTTTKIRVHSSPVIFSAVTPKPQALANNLVGGVTPYRNEFKYSDGRSPSGGSASVSSESKQDDEEYSESEQSDEQLSPQQSQYSVHHHHDHQPWNDGAGAEPRNYVGQPDYQGDDASKPASESEEDYRSPSESVEHGHVHPSSPKPAARRLDQDAPDFNGIVTEFAYKYGSSHELEHLAAADDDQISRYFVKTKPKEVSFSVSPIIDYTSTTPFAVAGGPTAPSFLSQSSERSKSALLHGGSITSAEYSASANGPFGYTQTTTTLRPNQDFEQKRPYSFHEIPDTPTQAAFSSSIPATSNNYLTSVTDKDSLGDSAHLSSVTPTAPAVTTTTDATSIPGIPGIDYPILSEIPYTGFDCQKQRYKGFFADVHTKCQAWHYCDFTDGHSTFLCPNGTLFSQVLLTCDWWFNVDCTQAQQLYVLNERLYRYIKPPKPSFPEDFHGPQVDLWLVQQLQLGLLPKMKKKVKDKVVINN